MNHQETVWVACFGNERNHTSVSMTSLCKWATVPDRNNQGSENKNCHKCLSICKNPMLYHCPHIVDEQTEAQSLNNLLKVWLSLCTFNHSSAVQYFQLLPICLLFIHSFILSLNSAVMHIYGPHPEAASTQHPCSLLPQWHWSGLRVCSESQAFLEKPPPSLPTLPPWPFYWSL